jgi:hypothetical protein
VFPVQGKETQAVISVPAQPHSKQDLPQAQEVPEPSLESGLALMALVSGAIKAKQKGNK